MLSQSKIESAYKEAEQRYAQLGVNTDKILRTLENVSLSLPCWQGDDLKGFEIRNSELVASGLHVTGSYPGRARTIDELRQDLEKACLENFKKETRFSFDSGNHCCLFYFRFLGRESF